MYYRSVVRSIFHLQMNPVVKIFIVADFLFWSSINFYQPLLALFIVGQIPGGNALTVGFATTVYLLGRVIPEIPVGVWLDRTRSQRDDHAVLVLGTFVEGLLYFAYPHVGSVWQLYAVMVMLGVTSSFTYPSWRAIFTRYVDKTKVAFEWSMYDVLVGIGMAFGASLGAFLVAQWGFVTLFYVVGIGVILSSLLILSVRRFIK